MHLTLKTEATRPAAHNVLQQQMRFDTFVDRFNRERPHQALDMATPASCYKPSARPYQGLEELDYPAASAISGARSISVRCMRDRKWVLKQTAEHIWLVTFMDYDLGYFDDETCRLEPIENPFGPKVLALRSE